MFAHGLALALFAAAPPSQATVAPAVPAASAEAAPDQRSPPPKPTAARAESLARAAQWDELYLSFAAVKRESLVKAEVPRVAAALAKGCAALLQSDAVLAQSLGERSALLDGPVEAVLCAADAAVRADQNATAVETYALGAARFPREARLALAQGTRLLEDGESEAAVTALLRVPKTSPLFAAAQPLLERAQAAAVQVAKARAELEALEAVGAEAGGRAPGRREAIGAPTGPRGGGSASWESAVDAEGRRTRGNAHFRFRYFSGHRDFGQRADYEGRVQAALEDARGQVRRLLGESRETPLDVILYSREEFSLHHGPRAAATVAGFYAQGAIRMNDSEEIGARLQATLVHEYTHAVFDELASFNASDFPTWVNEGLAEYLEWRFEGHDRPPLVVGNRLRALAQQDRLPPLAQLAVGPFVGQGPSEQQYAQSACAIRLVVNRIGLPGLVRLIRAVGRGAEFEGAFENATGESLERFDAELARELASR